MNEQNSCRIYLLIIMIEKYCAHPAQTKTHCAMYVLLLMYTRYSQQARNMHTTICIQRYLGRLS